MYCTKCGKEIKEGATFCINCGKKVYQKDKKKDKEEKEEKKVTKKKSESKKESVKEKKKPDTNVEKTETKEEKVNSSISDNTPRVSIQSKEQTSATAIASLVLGIVSFAFSFLLSIIALPLSIAGFCLGISTKQKSGIKTGGIILNILGAIISILIFIFYGTMIIVLLFNLVKHNNIDDIPHINNNPVEGEWECKAYDGYEKSSEYVLTFELDDDYDFTWYKYGDMYANHVKGTYNYIDLNKSSENGKYKHYNLILRSDEYTKNGNSSTDEHVTKYEIRINEEDDEAILVNSATYSKYYCYR